MNRIAGIILVLGAAVSCAKATLETAYTKQAEKIEKFVSSQVDADSTRRVIYSTGATRVVLSEGSGEEVSSKGLVSIDYAGYDFSGGSISNSTLFTTNSADVAAGAKWTLSDSTAFRPVIISLKDESILSGLRHGLAGVRAGEECFILFTGKFASPKGRTGTVPASAPMAFHIWVNDIENP